MVARKMESNCQAMRETPLGAGMNHRMTPVAIDAMSGLMAAPCDGCGLGAGGGAAAAVANATVSGRRFGAGSKKGDFWSTDWVRC